MIAAALLCFVGMPAFAHRLDEYLQGTILSIEKDRLQAQMTLTPGVAIFPFLIATIDSDKDGEISYPEQRAYAARVLHDLSIAIDGQALTPQVASIRFPTMLDIQEGRGEIQLDFSAELPSGGKSRTLTMENHHQSGISAYQVNCLVPHDPDIRIAAQVRNYSQSLYRLEYERTDIRSGPRSFKLWSNPAGWLAMFAILVFTRLSFVWRRTRLT